MTARQTSYLDPAPRPRKRPLPLYRSRERQRLAVGVHPTGIAMVRQPPGERCGTCAHRVEHATEAGRWVVHHKCDLLRAGWTRGRMTDVLADWPACTLWQGKEASCKASD